jgi:hypothetical protein
VLGDELQQPVGAHRLGDVADRPQRLAAVVALLVRGEEDHRDVGNGLVGLERGDELEAVHVRHVDVGDDQRRRAAQHDVAGGDRVLGDVHLVARGREMQLQQLADAFVVVDDQDAGGHFFYCVRPMEVTAFTGSR